MQIIANLDAQHYDKLTTLQAQLNKDATALLQLAIDSLYEHYQLNEGQKALAILQKNGFIGCLQGDGDLLSRSQTLFGNACKSSSA